MAQALLAASEDGLIIPTFEIDDAIGLQASLGESRRKEIRPGEAPENLAVRACRDPGGEERRSSAIDGTVATASHLMKRPMGQPAAGEARVHGGKAERQHASNVPVATFDLADLHAQSFDGGRGPHGSF